MSGSIRVLLLSSGLRAEAEVVRMLAGPSVGIDVVRRCLDLPDMLGHARAAQVDAVLVSAAAPGLQAALLDEIRGTGAAVVLLAQDPAQAGAAAAMGVGCAHVSGEGSPGPAAAAGVIAALEAACRPAAGLQAAPSAPGAGPAAASGPVAAGSARLIGVWGPAGSPGRSSLAQVIAAGAARPDRTVLVDADTAGPAQAVMNAVGSAASGLLSACRSMETTGRVDLLGDAVEVPVGSGAGFHLLTGPADPGRGSEIRPDALRAVLASARSTFDAVVLDLPAAIHPPASGRDLGWAPHPTAAARVALAECDLVVAVMRCEPVGAARFAVALPRLLESTDAEILVVANGLGDPAGGPKAVLQARRVLQHCAPGHATVEIGHYPREFASARSRCRPPGEAGPPVLRAELAGLRAAALGGLGPVGAGPGHAPEGRIVGGPATRRRRVPWQRARLEAG